MTSAPLYCLCQQPYDVNHFMIECDLCQDWFHGSCVGVDERKAARIDIYHCPACEVVHGPSIMKKCHRSSRKHRALKKQPVKTGSRIFIRQLQGKTFDSPDEVILKPKGNQLTVEFLEKNSFSKPILILKKDGLGMTLPPTSFTVRDVEQHVGSDKEIDVIDVARQASCKMMLGDFVKYYYSKKRGKIFNVINLEFSNTRLSNIVEMPKIVQKLSWIENLWPGECGFERPNIQKYCFMSVQDSYTDFHIEFGGTSVWYHVLKGEKIFYLIHPTDANLTLFECWSNSSRRKEMFFGDQVDKCYKCPVKQGQTLFIPTGWIHAVLTPVDCLAFGGNFLHSLNIEMQLKAYETGRQLTTPVFFKFPSFETICWHVGQHILDILGGLRENGRSPASYLVCGGKALSLAFRAWTRKEVLPDHEDEIPKTVQPTQLMEDLDREIRLVEDIFQQNIQKPSTIFGLPMFFHTNSSPLSRPNHSASLSKPTLAVPSKSGSKKKGPKHRDIFKKTEQKGRESPALGPDGCHGDSLMDVNNPPALKLGSCQNVVFNITTACLNGSDDASESNKVFDESEYPVSPLKANRSTKKTKKSLSNSWRAKIMKKDGNSRMVERQVIGGNSDLKSNEELLVKKRLNKEEMSLVVSPKLFPNVPRVEFCSDENQIIERREAEITTEDNHKIDEEMVEGVEGKHSNGSGSDRNFGPLKARKQVGGPGCVVFTEDLDSSSNKKATQDSVLVANLHSSPPSPAPSTPQALLSGEQGQGNESSSSALGTVSKSPVSQRPPRKWPIKRLKYWRPKGKGDSASGGGSGSGFEDSECIYIILESDDEYDDPVLKPPPKKRKISDDAPWTPRACVTPTLPKQDHPAHESTGVASAEIGLAATAAKLAYQNKAINGENKT